MARHYFRIQPAGADLFSHTSCGSSDEPIEAGSIFAFTTPTEVVRVIGDWLPDYYLGSEVVEFEGEDAYDPGDYEGIAVWPTREVRRMPFEEWVMKYGNGQSVANYQEIVEWERE